MNPIELLQPGVLFQTREENNTSCLYLVLKNNRVNIVCQEFVLPDQPNDPIKMRKSDITGELRVASYWPKGSPWQRKIDTR